MLSFLVAAAATGALVLGGSNRARADLLVALAEDAGAFMVVATSSSAGNTPNAVSFNGAFMDFSVDIDTTSSNFPPGAQTGVDLETTTNTTLGAGGGTHTLHVLAEIVPSGSTTISPLASIPLPAGGTLAVDSQLATTGSPVLFTPGSNVSFTSTVNGTAFGPIMLTTVPDSIDKKFTDGSSPYTLTNLTDVKLVGAGAEVGSTGTTTVTATPEPATIALALSGLPVLGLLCARSRRRRA
jgi:hypothetical protein